MVTATSKESKATMGSIDAALKPRLRLRTPTEYAGWVLSILVGIGILTSVLTNPNFKWGVVAQYFTLNPSSAGSCSRSSSRLRA